MDLGGGLGPGGGVAGILQSATNIAGTAAEVVQAANTPVEENIVVQNTGPVAALVLTGDGNANTLIGGPGNDEITGGLGQDTLTGGGGSDFFRFTSANDSTTSAPDTITDFVSGVDKIALFQISGTNGKTFDFIGTSNFTGSSNNKVEARQNNGNLEIDTSDNGSANMQINLIDKPTLTDNDFIFVPASS